MSQIPPSQPPFAPQPPDVAYESPGVGTAKKTNVPAIISIVCGVLGCVPFVTGLAAVILGVVGLRKTKDPQTGGKPLAIIGIILGVISLGGWTLFGGGIFALVKGTEAQRDVARQFISDLAAGNVDAAVAQTDGTIGREDVEQLSATVRRWGPLTDTTVVGVSAEPGRTQIAGSATFGTSPKSFQAIVVKQTDGSYKISGIDFK